MGGVKGEKGDPGLSVSAALCVDASTQLKVKLEFILVWYALIVIVLAALAVIARLALGWSLGWLAVAVLPALLVGLVSWRFPSLGILLAALAIIAAVIVNRFSQVQIRLTDLKAQMTRVEVKLDGLTERPTPPSPSTNPAEGPQSPTQDS
jgi:hypothetical protein